MSSTIQQYIQTLGDQARLSAKTLSKATTNQKNTALIATAHTLEKQQDALSHANENDLSEGEKNGLDSALLDRLELTKQRISAMIEGLHQVARLPDPIGVITDLNYQPSGIQVGKMRVPLGVIGIIYESRPNVTVEAASLCLKSGNAVILRGGSEAIHSNLALAKCIQLGLQEAGLTPNAVQFVETTDRQAVREMIQLTESIDIIIPRGGKSLVELISNHATIPVIKHLDGICHVYIDDQACFDKALRIADNSKTQRYGTCNTMETLLIHSTIAKEILPKLTQLFKEKSVELRGCKDTCKLYPKLIKATEEDWQTEYLAPILSIKLVDHLDDAITHINHYGSHHTDTIVTENLIHARQFLAEIDSSSVIINASTRFADGFEYGLGAEIGISTDKLHARGPVGLEGLTSQKFIVFGNGHIRH